jgi:hypothetical protein
VALALVLALQGCATPGRSNLQTVRVETPGCQPVSCELSNDRGRWSLASTPGTVEVSTSLQPLLAICHAGPGIASQSASISPLPTSTSEGAVAGGVAGGVTAGAIFGSAALTFIPVLGLLVVGASAAAGAAGGQAIEARNQTQAYPSLIVIPMQCIAPAAP